jgi:hypothetical protein
MGRMGARMVRWVNSKEEHVETPFREGGRERLSCKLLMWMPGQKRLNSNERAGE